MEKLSNLFSFRRQEVEQLASEPWQSRSRLCSQSHWHILYYIMYDKHTVTVYCHIFITLKFLLDYLFRITLKT